MTKSNKVKYIVMSAFIASYGILHFFTSYGSPLLRLSDIFFNIAIVSLMYALLLELLNKNFFKIFAYPIYIFRKSGQIFRQQKRNQETDKMLSLYEYELKDARKRQNKLYYILAVVFGLLSAAFALLLQ